MHPQQAQTCEMIRHYFVLLLLLAHAVRGNMSPRVPAPASSGRPGQVLKDEADALHQRGKAVLSIYGPSHSRPGELKGASFTPPPPSAPVNEGPRHRNRTAHRPAPLHRRHPPQAS